MSCKYILNTNIRMNTCMASLAMLFLPGMGKPGIRLPEKLPAGGVMYLAYKPCILKVYWYNCFNQSKDRVGSIRIPSRSGTQSRFGIFPAASIRHGALFNAMDTKRN